MRAWDAPRVAAAAGARILDTAEPDGGPAGVGIDTRSLSPGDLFIGLRGEREDGGRHAEAAIAAGAWGVMLAPEHAERLRAGAAGPAAVLVHPDPLAGLQALARSWRHELGARVVAITGSTGKTSTKDILAALLSGHQRTAATPANLNTEIGLPLALLRAPAGTECVVLEMAMRGPGQIAALTAIAAPDVGVIVNVGPAHLELLGSLEAIAAAKAELIAGLEPGRTAVVPAGEQLLARHLRPDLRTLTFGPGGDVELRRVGPGGAVTIAVAEESVRLEPSFAERHNLLNLLAAVAVAHALGVHPEGRLDVRFSARRGARHTRPDGVTVVDDCYNANPMSMRAAIDELARLAAGRRIAVLGDMLELGPQAPEMHRELARHAAEQGIDVLVAVGSLAGPAAAEFTGERHTVADAEAAAELVGGLVRPGDTVLVKGSRGVGLERVVEELAGTSADGSEHGELASASRSGGGGRR